MAKREWHGHASFGKRTRTYIIWKEMCRRCATTKGASDSEKEKRKNYADRGISVCKRWRDSFLAFLEDMGTAPDQLTIDRINNDDGYYKDNCRWATRLEQSWNSRRTRLLTYQGKTQSHRAWARQLGMGEGTFRKRLQAGWPIEEAVIPPKPKRRGRGK